MNDYLKALQGMPLLWSDMEACMKLFNRKDYRECFQKQQEKHRETFEALDREYLLVIDKDQLLTNMAQAIADEAVRMQEAAGKKRAKELLESKQNMMLITYIFPLILEQDSAASKPFADCLFNVWKQRFPKSRLQGTVTFEEIAQGFHHKYCYVTTAVCRTLGKSDDCYELNLFRQFRDGYMASLPEGPALIDAYYDLAPSIVKHIGQREDSEAIYRNVWEQYLIPCIRMIESGQNEDCIGKYREMVETLKDKYFLYGGN